jgi:NADH:ubiquinone oxidoreductase subunit C
MVYSFNFFKKHTYLQFNNIMDIIVIDTPQEKNRFKIIYHLLSIEYNVRLNIYIYLKELYFLFSLITINKGVN